MGMEVVVATVNGNGVRRGWPWTIPPPTKYIMAFLSAKGVESERGEGMLSVHCQKQGHGSGLTSSWSASPNSLSGQGGTMTRDA